MWARCVFQKSTHATRLLRQVSIFFTHSLSHFQCSLLDVMQSCGEWSRESQLVGWHWQAWNAPPLLRCHCMNTMHDGFYKKKNISCCKCTFACFDNLSPTLNFMPNLVPIWSIGLLLTLQAVKHSGSVFLDFGPPCMHQMSFIGPAVFKCLCNHKRTKFLNEQVNKVFNFHQQLTVVASKTMK